MFHQEASVETIKLKYLIKDYCFWEYYKFWNHTTKTSYRLKNWYKKIAYCIGVKFRGCFTPWSAGRQDLIPFDLFSWG